MYLTGPDAQEAADWLFTADTDKEPGHVVYTCSLNSKGGIEADVIVIPLQEGVGTLVGPILKVNFFFGSHNLILFISAYFLYLKKSLN